jgi:hypothetical protein
VLLLDQPATDSTTPILDSGVLPPCHRLVRPKAVAGALVIGVSLMEGLALLGGLRHEHWALVFLMLVFLAVVVHEVGHLVAGWAVGFHFSSIQVGPLWLECEYGALRARISFDMIAFGYAAMYADRVRKLRRRSLVFIAGGPAANLLTVIIVGSLLRLPWTSGLATAAAQFGAVSLLLAMLSLVPLTSNDGALIEMLISSPLPARRWISALALGAQFNQGIRARNWKRTWIRAATYLRDKSRSEFYSNWTAYLFANDSKDICVAARYLEGCLEQSSNFTTPSRDLVALEAAVFSAWFRHDLDLAEKWALQVRKRRSLSPILQIRVEVALNCAGGDFDAALITWERGLKLIQEMPMNPIAQALLESWIEWRTEITQRQEQLTTA